MVAICALRANDSDECETQETTDDFSRRRSHTWSRMVVITIEGVGNCEQPKHLLRWHVGVTAVLEVLVDGCNQPLRRKRGGAAPSASRAPSSFFSSTSAQLPCVFGATAAGGVCGGTASPASVASPPALLLRLGGIVCRVCDLFPNCAVTRDRGHR